MCTCRELMLSTYEKKLRTDMLGSKRFGGEELPRQGSVIKLVTRLPEKGSTSPFFARGVGQNLLRRVPTPDSLELQSQCPK